MKNFILAILIMLICNQVHANEWIGAREIKPSMVYNQYGPYYYYSSQTVIVPVVPRLEYVPVTTYQNVVVEKYTCCLIKRYEIVPVINTVYVPVWSLKNY